MNNIDQEMKNNYPKFDIVFSRHFYDRIIHYGIIKGSNKILFIKPGLDGSLVGYKDKYYNLATYINEKYGFTCICSNNPYDKEHNPLDDATEVINDYANEMKYDTYEVYYLGNSNGGVLGARYAYKYENFKRLLLINPPLFISYYKIKEGIEKFNGEKIVFIYGSLDPSIKFVELLDFIKNDKVSYQVLEGEDHNLSSGTYSLEYLIETYLLKD